MSQTTTTERTYQVRQPRTERVPEWRRRQLEELDANGGRIIARSVTRGGSVAL